MSRFAEKIREAFRLKPGEPEKIWRAEALKMRDLVGFVKDQRDLIEPEDMWISADCMCAVVAAAFANLRRNDADWMKLDPDTAWRLYVGVVIDILIKLYKKDSIPKREARKHEAEK